MKGELETRVPEQWNLNWKRESELKSMINRVYFELLVNGWQNPTQLVTDAGPSSRNRPRTLRNIEDSSNSSSGKSFLTERTSSVISNGSFALQLCGIISPSN